MMNKPIRALILDAADNASEAFLSLLHKNSIAVNAERFMDRKLLVASLKSDDWDMLLLNEDVEDCEVSDFVSYIKKAKKHTVVFVLTSRPVTIDALTMLQLKGVAGLVSLEHPDYSVTAIRREHAALQLRRQQVELLCESAELKERCRLLLDSSREAIAYVHDGMHVYANGSYIELFGYQSIDDVLCTPYIDMVAAANRTQLKDCLKTMPRHSGNAEELSIQALDAEGNEFVAQMILTPTLYEGEQCLQVFVSREQAVETKEMKAELATEKAQPVAPAGAAVPLQPHPHAAQVDKPQPVVNKSGAGLSGNTIIAGMSNGQLNLVYHPVIATADMEPELYDVVLNLLDTKATRCKPDELRSAIYALPMDSALDKWVLDRAVRVIADLHRSGQNMTFMLPLSVHALANGSGSRSAESEANIVNWLVKLINGLSLDPAALVINLHQTDVLGAPDAAGAIIRNLREAGINACINHFQPHPEINAFLAKHPVGYLRLTGDLTRSAVRDKTVAATVRDIVTTLHTGNTRVIATQIEDFEALSALWEAGVDLVQGEYFQKFAKDLHVDSFAEQNGLLRYAG